MSLEWRLYVADMREFCARVAEYTDGLSREEFEKTRLVYDATLRNLELIGEAALAAASKLPKAVCAYTLRHSAITDLVRSGLDLFHVAQLAGTSVAMIEKHYGHLQREQIRKGLNVLSLSWS